MLTIEELKDSVLNRMFVGANPLPLPFYVFFVSSLIQKIPIVTYVFNFYVCSLTVFLILCYFTLKYTSKSYESLGTYDFLVVALFVLRTKNDIQATLTGLLVFIILKQLYHKNLLSTSIFLCVLTATDTTFIPVIVVILLSLLYDITNDLISPKITVKDTIKKGSMVLCFIVIVPMVFVLSFMIFDLFIRNTHSIQGLKYSLEFQANLKNFNIKSGMDQGHESIDSQPTDLFVMDRSFISLISAKHRTFFSLNDQIKSSFNSVTFAEIHKIHAKEFTDEEPRFIKNGDIVKFKSITHETSLGWTKKDDKEKFRIVDLKEYKEKEDFWIVETDGYLKARTQAVRFKSSKSNDYLCARKVKKLGTIAVSYAAEEYSKDFYITENTNHSHYKTTFADTRAKETVTDFNNLPFWSMVAEFLSSIDLKYNYSKQDFRKTVGVIKYFSFLLFFITSITLASSYTVTSKYNKPNFISSRTVNSLLLLVLIIFLFPLIGFKLQVFELLSLIFAASLAQDFLKGSEIKLLNTKKPNKKKKQ